jgi:hypothetical protein
MELSKTLYSEDVSRENTTERKISLPQNELESSITYLKLSALLNISIEF